MVGLFIVGWREVLVMEDVCLYMVRVLLYLCLWLPCCVFSVVWWLVIVVFYCR